MPKMHNMMRFLTISICVTCLVTIAGCSNAKEKLGLNKKAPDEFAVVKRAPLSLPPDYSLRPPRPGAPRPQESEPSTLAKQTVFGEQTQYSTPQTQSNPEAILLQQAGATGADPDIRAKVDSETSADLDENKPVAQKLLNMISEDAPSSSVVDQAAEAERIKTNQQEGKPLTEGDTPAVVE